jgi:DNA-directed RNA polymerase subunit RPC12/RpoP
MRLPWQCPTCYAELGDKSYAKMLTCPYCGSLLLVDHKNKKFLRVPKKNGSWHYFSKVPSPGYIKFGEYEEHYFHYRENWYLLKEEQLYIMDKEIPKKGYAIEERGVVEYIWGEFPFVAPPGSEIMTAYFKDGIIKIFSRVSILFLKSDEEIPDEIMKIFQG